MEIKLDTLNLAINDAQMAVAALTHDWDSDEWNVFFASRRSGPTASAGVSSLPEGWNVFNTMPEGTPSAAPVGLTRGTWPRREVAPSVSGEPHAPSTADAAVSPIAPTTASSPPNENTVPPVPTLVPPVPVAPAGPATDLALANAGTMTHDSEGLPWDERIHAGSHGVNADGTWRAKRGVDAAVAAAVRAELLGTPATPDPTTVGFGQSTPAAAVLPPPAPVPAVTPVAGWPECVPVNPGESPFQAFMRYVAPKLNGGGLTTSRLVEIVRSVGLNMLPELDGNPDRIPAVVQAIEGAA